MISLSQMTPHDRRAILLGAAALLAVVVVRWVLVPWAISWQQARQEITVAQSQLDALENQVRRHLSQRDRLTAMYGNAVAKPLEDMEPATLRFGEAVQAVMGRSGIRDPAYQPQQPRGVPGAPEVEMVTLRMTGRCQLPDLARCLAELRRADSLIVVDSLVATGDTRPQQQGQMEVTMLLSTPAKTDRRRS
ncbi:MAG: type II secretion system protein M [Phycisphaerae bacterium]|nr:type II secretion system protein M [Phycisphaerae bacterium]